MLDITDKHSTSYFSMVNFHFRNFVVFNGVNSHALLSFPPVYINVDRCYAIRLCRSNAVYKSFFYPFVDSTVVHFSMCIEKRQKIVYILNGGLLYEPAGCLLLKLVLWTLPLSLSLSCFVRAFYFIAPPSCFALENKHLSTLCQIYTLYRVRLVLHINVHCTFYMNVCQFLPRSTDFSVSISQHVLEDQVKDLL